MEEGYIYRGATEKEMMEKSEIKKRLDVALAVAKEASSFLLSHSFLSETVEEKNENDFVTQADKASESLIYEAIERAFPSDGWFGEETGKQGDGKRRWIVDPIDGTVNYFSSFPNYTVSIAFEDEDGLALGVVVVPRQNELFWAMRGEGAYLNGERIHTKENCDFSKTLAILVPPHRKHGLMEKYWERMRKFYDIFTDVRSIGSAALSLCYVAAGRCTMYYEMSLYPYDYSAGRLILEEAGGRVDIIQRDGESMDVVASSSTIFEKVMEVIGEKSSVL